MTELMTGKAVLIFFLLAVGFSGCLAPLPTKADKPAAGTATYVFQGDLKNSPAAVHITLRLASQVRSQDGQFLSAYRFSVEDSRAPTYELLTDGAFRLVRWDEPCIGKPCTGLFWRLSLHPLPLGIGYLKQFQDQGSLTFADRNRAEVKSFIPKLSEVGGRQILRIDVSDLPASQVSIAGNYTYDANPIFPVDVDAGGMKRHRTKFEKLAELTPIPKWPLDPGPMAGGANRFFAGDDKILPTFGIVPIEAINYLTENDAQARETLDGGGCLVHFLVTRSHPQKTALPTPALATSNLTVQVVLQAVDGNARRWSFDWETDALGRQAFGNLGTPSGANSWAISEGCHAARKSPIASFSASTFIQMGLELNVTSPAQPDFYFLLQPSKYYGLLPEQGWSRYGLIYYPPGSDPTASGTFFPNYVQMHANPAIWDTMQVPTQDAERIGFGHAP
jgi:hypothetical protein